MKVQQAILDYLSIPDLNKMSTTDVATFLESSEFSSQQRKQVLDTDDKVRMYSKINRLRNINKAGAAIYEGRLSLRTSGIFLPAPIAKAFKDGFDMLSFAQVEQQLEFEGRGVREQPKSIELLGAGGELFLSTLGSLVRSTIRRD
jgi:predicted flap endonuclease-1-like 5' DNA nuclease